jgi:hypothetical protein
MRFRVGEDFAKCYGCGREDFFPALALSAGRRNVFICAHCGYESYYGELTGSSDESGEPEASGNGSQIS